MRLVLQLLNLPLQLLELHFLERRELSVQLVDALAVEAELLVPHLDLSVAHGFLLRDGGALALLLGAADGLRCR